MSKKTISDAFKKIGLPSRIKIEFLTFFIDLESKYPLIKVDGTSFLSGVLNKFIEWRKDGMPGLYTGVKDCNGKRVKVGDYLIYEGIYEPHETWFAQVVFEDFAIRIKQIGFDYERFNDDPPVLRKEEIKDYNVKVVSEKEALS